MVKATEVVYKYYEVEFALKRGNNDALAWFGLFLAGINKSKKLNREKVARMRRKRGARRLEISADNTNQNLFSEI